MIEIGIVVIFAVLVIFMPGTMFVLCGHREEIDQLHDAVTPAVTSAEVVQACIENHNEIQELRQALIGYGFLDDDTKTGRHHP